MAEGTFKGLLVGFILVGVFMFATLTFAITIAEDYGYDSDDITGGKVDLDKVTTYLDDVGEAGESSDKRYKEIGIISIIGGETFSGIWEVITGISLMITTPFDFLAQILTLIFHVPRSVINALMGIVLFIVIFGIWRVVRIGE